MPDHTGVRIPCPTIYPKVESWHAGMPPGGPPTVRYNVPCEGYLRACRICGTVRYCSREARCLDDDAPSHWQRQHFGVEDYYPAGGIAGWTRGEHWNGWACPRFELAEAQVVASAEVNEGRLLYDPVDDAFVSPPREGEDGGDRWPGEDIDTAEGVKRVYPIGAWAWVWDSEEEWRS